MTFDTQRIAESKDQYRRKLASLPVGEKLRLLDRLREREMAIRGARKSDPSGPEKESAGE